LLIDGAAIGRLVRRDVAAEVERLKALGITPRLSVVLVGNDPASAVYVRSKGKACEEAGMRGETIRLPAETTENALLAQVDRLNADPNVHGILVQMPLPRHIAADKVIRRIRPEKDVDGFHPVNVGKLSIGERDGFVPCTPAGAIELLVRSGVETRGKDAVIVGRSNIVGKPEMITGDMIKPGAVVIDVGINRVNDAAAPKGYRIVGDVHFASARDVASLITPVPGGVGPMTIAMLMKNTVRAAAQIAGV
jgi:methylenetetrahydrofolate dehydrogenase (NADP+)/methenyltetrahydrofolate cyclohydrolase